MPEEINRLKSEIVGIYGKEPQINNLFLFEQISPKRLSNAKSGYARNLTGDETIILLYDDTLFGSAKNGFLLTTKRIYYKNMGESPSLVDITSIRNKEVVASTLSTQMLIHLSTDGKAAIDITYIEAKQREPLLRMLGNIIDLLRNSGANLSSDIDTKMSINCGGCGAASQSAVCEYCGNRMR